ncbi:transcription initiation factor IIB [Sporothrix bragantina]|uniref:Transcription initiation factor IIB n=1 Tax=Sporothrix bragantina TaxID=671064 RepID=A0ABP0B2D9_9PEZI
MPAFTTVPPAPPVEASALPFSLSVSLISSLSVSLTPSSSPSPPSPQPPSDLSLSASPSSSPSSSPLPHMIQLLAARGNVTASHTPNQSPTPTAPVPIATPTGTSGHSKPWLAGAIVGAVVAVVAAIALLAFWWAFRRRRRQRYEQARQYDPQLTPDQFLGRRSHMSEAALTAEAERARRAIIRKSIMSRSSASLSFMEGTPAVVPSEAVDEGLGYRGVPLGHQRQPVAKPLVPGGPSPTIPQTQTHDHDIPEGYYPEPITTAADIPSAPAAPPAVGLRDDYKEWTASLRRHTSRVAERHPSVVEEDREEEEQTQDEAQRQPLVVHNPDEVPDSPPIPPRSRLRPLSTADLPSQAIGFLPQVHGDDVNNGNNSTQADMTSPTSLYSVDNNGRRYSSAATTHSPLFRQLALNLLCEKTDADVDSALTPETKHSIVLVLDTLDAKTKAGRVAKRKLKSSKKTKANANANAKATVARKPLRELHNKAVQSTLVGFVSKATSISSTSSSTKALSTSSTTTTKMDAAAAREAYKENLDNIILCPDCKEFPPNLVEEFSSGDMVCDSCGLVVGPRIIDSRSEWRTFANDDQGNDDPSRVGESANSLANDEGLRTQVDMRAANGKLAGKLNSINKKSQSEKLNNDLQEGFRAISGLVDMMQTSGIVGQTAMHIYKLAYEHGQLKGKPREAVIAGCIFIACRQCGVPRTFREIYAITRVTKKEIGRVFKSLESFLSKIQEKNPQASAAQGVKDYKASSSTTAEELCTRYCSLLGFRNTPRMEKISKALARKTTGIPDLAGRSPLSVAAACIYFASQYLDDPRASKDIASIAGVSDGTIKTAYRFLYNARETLVEADWNGKLENLSSS